VPAEIVAGTRARYVDAYERITGLAFADWYGPGPAPAAG
jgi:phosphoribosylaminoimidazole-succinocarboxamide synthase